MSDIQIDSQILRYEKKYLLDFLETMKILKPEFGIKIERIGDLAVQIAKELNFYDDNLLFASYYANIGFLALDQYLDSFSGNQEQKQELLKQHLYYGADFCKRKKLFSSAEMIMQHHNLPNGEGYFEIIVKDKKIATIQIADSYIGMVCPTRHRPPLSIEYSISQIIRPYLKTRVFEDYEIETIKNILNSFYKERIEIKKDKNEF